MLNAMQHTLIGYAFLRVKDISEKGCYEALIDCHAAIFGVSAGSMNMAHKTVDFFESIEAFDGLGLTNITVICHHDPEKTWRYEQTLRMSEERTVYKGFYRFQFALYNDEQVFFGGEYEEI